LMRSPALGGHQVMRLCPVGFISSQRNPRYCDELVAP